MFLQKGSKMKKTNWDQYYNKPAFFSRYTRLYTQSWIVNTLNNLLHDNIKLAEFGGGNSCFHDKIIQKCNIRSYTIYDNNSIGIRKFKDKYPPYKHSFIKKLTFK